MRRQEATVVREKEKVMKIILQPPLTDDLTVMYCGSQVCDSLYSYGPMIREYYVIHYIKEGKGMLHINDKKYYLAKGQCFVIFPHYLHYYMADKDEPWSYAWIAFNGSKAAWYLEQANLTVDNPIFHYNINNFFDEINMEMHSASQDFVVREAKLLAVLYRMLSEIIHNYKRKRVAREDMKEYYFAQMVEYIKNNYTQNITVRRLSHYIGISPSYLYQIFRKCSNSSMHHLILKYRMDKAISLLPNKSLTIGDVSRSVGYEDPLQFSAIFKKIVGVSPRNYLSRIDRDINEEHP